MGGFRCDHLLASAVIALSLTAPSCVLAQETTQAPAEVPSMSPSGALTASAAAAAGVVPATPTLRASVTDEAPAPVPGSLVSLDPADRAVAERVRDLLAAKPNRIFADEKELAAVQAFYQQRNLAPLWLDKGVENARAKAAIARIKLADTDGLDHRDYETPSFASHAPDALAEAELTLTQSVLTYARHVQAGRVPYRLVQGQQYRAAASAPDPAAVLAAVAEAADADKALDQFAPQNEPYQKLKAALSQLRGASAGGREQVAAGPVLTWRAASSSASRACPPRCSRKR